MSAIKQPMLSSTHAIFRGLPQRLKAIISELPESADPALKEELVNAHRKLSDYFTKFDQSRYYGWAARKPLSRFCWHLIRFGFVSLDPRISYESLGEDYADDPELLVELEISKINLQSHFEQHYAAATPVPPPAAESQSELGSPQKVDFTSRLKSGDQLRPPQMSLLNISDSLVFRNRLRWLTPCNGGIVAASSSLSYTASRAMSLCIPGSAVAIERIFSGGRDTIGIRRASLKAETIETLMFVKARLRLARKAIIDLTGDEDDAI
ncbi:Transposase-like protein [Mycena venus]|uniref:Transposase-like protein n=1 Tax=Mycena venus TaxID=2733690 RepID=A0A8H7CQL7_9AGAR|nr:Transposase-like protein [Mycena venus]